jgi:hypothetical protein
MNGFAALCALIAGFTPPMGQMPITPTQTPTNLTEHLKTQDARLDGPRIQGVIYFDAPSSSGSQRILR